MGEILRAGHPPSTITIPSGQTASEPFATQSYAWGRLTIPADLTGTVFRVQTSHDGKNFVDAYDDAGVPMTFTPTGGTSHRIPDGAFPAAQMRIVSDSAEEAARSFDLQLST